MIIDKIDVSDEKYIDFNGIKYKHTGYIIKTVNYLYLTKILIS